MKMARLLPALLVTLLATTALLAEGNLLYSAPAWYPATDHFGSVVDTGDAFFNEGIVEVTFTLAVREPDGDWPYIELACETGDPITGTDSISVTYKCDTTLAVKLYQTDLGSEGIQSYALYQTVLPSSKEWNSVTIAVTDFVQPNWADAESRAIKLNLDNVARFYFTPSLDADNGGTSTVSLKELFLK